ncbi:unnamed protein product [Bursaphelenchus okinawaensis]|uniref:PRELI/MSF1 domain-containing protein n=1 Tax=Bursaphelenchus okinawaensis TaxID=465554 RepID=A0A811KAW2_9BILA|nr:unnamed protein product [Bursaphelenchus okinawaensis]CAG9098117.1 unnamed protein product [Bursaphelenchus okinawaensis]
MRFWDAPQYLFNYTFNEVSGVFYERYPNSYAKHIISEDVLDREITKDQIITRKLIVKKGNSFLNAVPKWMSKLASVKTIPTIEESVFDLKTRMLTTYTRNVAARDILILDEKCYYRPHDQHKTELQRAVACNVNYGRFSGLIEKVIVMTFRKSIKKTMAGFNEKLEERFGRHTNQRNLGLANFRSPPIKLEKV